VVIDIVVNCAIEKTTGGATMSLSREFAGFAADLEFEDLPPEVVDRAKGVTLQALSSGLMGRDMPASR
jgi:hypothetical protein